MAKSTLTQAKIAQLAKYIRIGAPMAVAFAASRVASSTYYRWMNIGQALYEGDLEHPDIPKRPTRKESESDRKYNRRLRCYDKLLNLYVTLYKTIRDAAALCQIDMLMVIRAAAIEKGDWRAAMWFLERHSPKDWNLKWIRHNLAAELKHQQQEHSIMDPELRELIRVTNEHRRAITKETEDDIRVKACNGSDSLP